MSDNIQYQVGTHPHWRRLFPSKNGLLGAHDLIEGEEVVLKISGINENKEITTLNGKKETISTITFECGNEMALNVTRCKVLESLYDADPDGWIGKYIQIYIGKAKLQGLEVDSIHIRQVVPNISFDVNMYKDMLLNCSDLDELKTVFTTFPKSVKAELATLKDERKKELS